MALCSKVFLCLSCIDIALFPYIRMYEKLYQFSHNRLILTCCVFFRWIYGNRWKFILFTVVCHRTIKKATQESGRRSERTSERTNFFISVFGCSRCFDWPMVNQEKAINSPNSWNFSYNVSITSYSFSRRRLYFAVFARLHLSHACSQLRTFIYIYIYGNVFRKQCICQYKKKNKSFGN